MMDVEGTGLSMFERYSRQMLFEPIGKEGQQKLANSKVLIIGMGALGTVLANHLVRAGVGYVRFVDRDYVEKSNLQRQMLFDEKDVEEALPKVIAAKRKLEKINSDVTLDPHVADVTADNIETFLEDIDIVVDGTDNFQTRFLFNDACYKKGIPFVYGGVVSSRGMTALFIPGKTPCLRCLFSGSSNSVGQTCDTVGVISPAVDVVVSYQVTECMKYLVGAESALRNSLLTFDVWNNYRYEVKLREPKKDCPTCQTHEYPALQFDEGDTTTVMCGRETVQINSKQSLNLDDWAERLAKVATVQKTPFLLRAQLEEGERLVLFPDGRVLVQGTEDIVRAKTIFARYVG